MTNADQRQRSPDVDLARAEAAVRELLLAIGEDPSREGLRDTPRRVARMYREIFAGLRSDPAEHLARTFDEPYDEIVALRDIDFTSMCEHHLLPFVGRVHIAYLPSNRIVGLSKLVRTVDAFARRPQVQERLTTQIADAIAVHLDARGVIVMVESEHFCMKVRGVKKSSSTMVTQAVRGVFTDDTAARHDALMLLRGKA